MKTYVLVWNPAKWPFDNYKQALKDIQELGQHVRDWSCVSKKIKSGDAVLLKKTGKGLRGIVASGTAKSEPYENRHWAKNKTGLSKQFVRVSFDRMADYTQGEILQVDDKVDFGFVPQASGCVLDDVKAEILMSKFHAYISAPIITPVVTIHTIKKRVEISARLRWQILDRDAHKCWSCGKSPPEVKLHVDHLISQADWRARYGSLLTSQKIEGKLYANVNDQMNLRAACSDCNLGKSSKTAHPPVKL